EEHRWTARHGPLPAGDETEGQRAEGRHHRSEEGEVLPGLDEAGALPPRATADRLPTTVMP
ncbi:MAG: hypothetical protein AVDCRST_MAG16-3208, partial [uncultured Frankineae bacterium]